MGISQSHISVNRLYWADAVKALAIWLMVLCHFGLRPRELHDFIYIFHMPVFFLISGYFDKGDSLSWEHVKKNFMHIMVPYFFFSVCSFSICWISPYIHPELYHNGTILQSFGKAFVGMFLMDDYVRPYAFLPTGALWFLVALFEMKIIFSLLCLCWRKCKWGISFIVALGVFVVWIKVPFFSIDSAFLALPFYIVGFLFKKYNWIELFSKRWKHLIVAVACWLYLAFYGLKNGEISLDGTLWGNNIILFYINAIVGSMACIYTFKAFELRNAWVSKVGASTLSILGTHSYLNKVGTVAAVLMFNVSPSAIPLWYIIMLSFMAMAFGVLVDKFLTRYLPWSLGKSK